MSVAQRCRVVAATALIACVSVPNTAAAFEIFGIRLFGGEPEEPPSPDAVSYKVDLSVAPDDGLEKTLRGASRLIDEEKEPSPGAAALLSRARGDYQRLLGTLYGAARYGPTISIQVDGEEAANIPVDAQFGDTADVNISVDPGPLFHFDNIDIVNAAGEVPEHYNSKVPRTPAELGLVTGGQANSTIVLASEAALVDRWRYKGYPKAAIANRNVTANHRNSTVDVGIRVDPGRLATFGDTSVSGTQYMDPMFVAYYAGITPGETYDPDQIDRARDQLRRLEVFQAVRILEGDEILPDGSLPMSIEVAERKRRVYGGGASYSTVDGIGLETYWRHRNLFGRAEKLNLEASVGGIDANDPDEYNYRVAATFIKPGVFNPYTDFSTTIFGEQDSPDTYRARVVGGRLGLTRRIGQRLTVSGFLSGEYSSIDQTTVGDGDFVFLSTPLTAKYDGSNSALNPTRGYRVDAAFEPFYEANHHNVGAISQLQGTVYIPITSERFVLAGRASAGSIVGAPLQEVPANKLFFAGGGGSIRGYPYRGVGPIDRNGDVIGGRSYFTASVEARVGVTRNIGIVPFLDMGNAFRDEFPNFSEPMRFGAGVGLRYNTGVGPIRLDVAVPLDPLEGDPNVAFYIGIGQAF
ncbi:autotransporter assembly complex protein TamA [Acuticoccus sp. M5D2P5]|uniref:autotransporter assembly complex protein TamA n=1 Tax=Acuticoccus kalidii TaxID=2910977 RepID=UPI001F1E0B60|nr:autotransporter assembly complex family protein [Acuticoccus kalidii]MCF3931960.1 autotransporter assembly complex protein TamA [Acuticoccus kalidii]